MINWLAMYHYALHLGWGLYNCSSQPILCQTVFGPCVCVCVCVCVCGGFSSLHSHTQPVLQSHGPWPTPGWLCALVRPVPASRVPGDVHGCPPVSWSGLSSPTWTPICFAVRRRRSLVYKCPDLPFLCWAFVSSSVGHVTGPMHTGMFISKWPLSQSSVVALACPSLTKVFPFLMRFNQTRAPLQSGSPFLFIRRCLHSEDGQALADPTPSDEHHPSDLMTWFHRGPCHSYELGPGQTSWRVFFTNWHADFSFV